VSTGTSAAVAQERTSGSISAVSVHHLAESAGRRLAPLTGIAQELVKFDTHITIGGLAPTVDDLTRRGVANAVNQKLGLRQDRLDELAEKFARFGSWKNDNTPIQAISCGPYYKG
jgi:hypothetical protein